MIRDILRAAITARFLDAQQSYMLLCEYVLNTADLNNVIWTILDFGKLYDEFAVRNNTAYTFGDFMNGAYPDRKNWSQK